MTPPTNANHPVSDRAFGVQWSTQGVQHRSGFVQEVQVCLGSDADVGVTVDVADVDAAFADSTHVLDLESCGRRGGQGAISKVWGPKYDPPNADRCEPQ